MKKFALAAAVTVAALVASVSSVRAQDKPMVQPTATGGPAMMVPMKMNASDSYKVSWVYHNLDAREVNRYRSEGLPDTTIKGAANIALRTGIPFDNIIRMVRESGYPLATVASMNNVPPKDVYADIPGYGVEYMGMMSPGMM